MSKLINIATLVISGAVLAVGICTYKEVTEIKKSLEKTSEGIDDISDDDDFDDFDYEDFDMEEELDNKEDTSDGEPASTGGLDANEEE